MIQTRHLMFLAYNPYRNRELKYEASDIDYYQYAVYTQQNVNFNPNDDVTTQVVINVPATVDFSKADYCLVLEDVADVESHWFVMECVRTKGGQYNVTLRRDVLVDFRRNIMDATSFVEKGYVGRDDPAILNSEDYKVNQIKAYEVLLKDKTQCPWIVGYLGNIDENIVELNDADFPPAQRKWAGSELSVLNDWFINKDGHIIQFKYNEAQHLYGKDMGLTRIPYSVEAPKNFLTAAQYEVLNSHSSAEHPYFIDSTYGADTPLQFEYSVATHREDAVSTYYSHKLRTEETRDDGVISSEIVSDEVTTHTGTPLGAGYRYVRDSYSAKAIEIDNATLAYFEDKYSETIQRYLISDQVANGYYAYNVDSTTTKYYKLTIDRGPTNKNFILETPTDNPNMLDSLAVASGYTINNNVDSDLRVLGKCRTYEYTFTEVTRQEYEESTSICIYLHKTWKQANNQPYIIFALPLSDTLKTVWKPGPGGSYSDKTNNSAINYGIAMGMSKQFSGAKILYDLQLLPYCPLQQWIVDGKIDLRAPDIVYSGYAGKVMYEPIKTIITNSDGSESETVAGFIYFVDNADFSFSIDSKITSNRKSKEFKAMNECRKYILRSPNYNGQFEFKPNFNGPAGIRSFDVNCTYKPITPFIRVCPHFDADGFYDKSNVTINSTGLICQGDFSLPQMNDSWTTYQLNNKNYVAIFNSQLATMERTKDLAYNRGVTNSMFAGLGAGIAGYEKGGIEGATLGAVSGFGAGLFNAEMSKQASQINIDNYETQHYYQLDNIRANPNSIQSVDAKTIINKLFPFYEVYDCTWTEFQSVVANLDWNGFTINRIGKFEDFINPNGRTRLKGYIINTDIHCDNHMLETINEELQKGVYAI